MKNARIDLYPHAVVILTIDFDDDRPSLPYGCTDFGSLAQVFTVATLVARQFEKDGPTIPAFIGSEAGSAGAVIRIELADEVHRFDRANKPKGKTADEFVPHVVEILDTVALNVCGQRAQRS